MRLDQVVSFSQNFLSYDFSFFDRVAFDLMEIRLLEHVWKTLWWTATLFLWLQAEFGSSTDGRPCKNWGQGSMRSIQVVSYNYERDISFPTKTEAVSTYYSPLVAKFCLL